MRAESGSYVVKEERAWRRDRMGETCINKPTNMHKHYCNEIFFLPLLLMLLHGLLVIFENALRHLYVWQESLLG